MVAISYNTLCSNRECGHPFEAHLPSWKRLPVREIFSEEVEEAVAGTFGCDFSDPADISHAVCSCMKFESPPRNQPPVMPNPAHTYTGPDTHDAEMRRVTVSELGLDQSIVLVLWWSGKVTWTTAE